MAEREIKRSDSAASPAAFYDDLSDSYHRLYGDWSQAIREQARALDRLLASRHALATLRILDCAVGIGTQALGLLQLGHEVWGTDLSSAAIRRARSESRRRRLDARLAVADMRKLPFSAYSFDVVICLDNSVAHLPSLEHIERALREMVRVTRPGGSVIVSIRDYEAARAQRLPGTLPQVNHTSGQETIAFQAWDWSADGCHYDLQHFVLTRVDESWRVTTRRATLYALTRAELVECARHSGLHDVELIEPTVADFFQPLIVASVVP
jgi:glycine/sarcosine N-methyltransferase